MGPVTGSRTAPPPSQQWATLNRVQQELLLATYVLDQAAEAHERDAWSDGRRRRPAEEWRWHRFGYVDAGPGAPPGKVRAALDATTRRSRRLLTAPAELADLGLVDQRLEEVPQGSERWWQPQVRLLSLRMTTRGRRVARTSGVDDRNAGRPPRGLVSQWLWEVIVELWRAGPGGVPADTRWSAWQYLEGRKTGPLIERVALTAQTASRWKYAVAGAPGWALNDAGRDHYRRHFATYARVYPAVRAPDPTGRLTWPGEVDKHLSALGSVAWSLRQRLDDVIARREELQRDGARHEAPRCPTDQTPPVSAEAAHREVLRAAADALDADHWRQRTALLAEHEPVLRALVRTSAARHAAAAIAAICACIAGHEPTSAVIAAEPLPLDHDGRPADLPVLTTGLPGIDAELATRRAAALAASPPAAQRRGRGRRQPPATPSLEPAAVELSVYAAHLADLVAGGQLQRLLLRTDQQTDAAAPTTA
ncbi:hypothetical protein SAMN05421812_12816 [Asanoa hainanensis]|uniref:Uncharacterized protein n=1 Tax=Asanoa hainanensis TaxID=560556 RepID=A0A239PFV3_9ACTN|nr:hypothetical protein SAMN05421812_12816 [Asanoa hainanensis]